MENYNDIIKKQILEEKKDNLEMQKDLIRKQELMAIQIEKLQDMKCDSNMSMREYRNKLYLSITFIVTFFTMALTFISNPVIYLIVWTLVNTVTILFARNNIKYDLFGYDKNYRYHQERIESCDASIKDYENKIKQLDKELNIYRKRAINLLELLKNNEPAVDEKIEELKKIQEVLNSSDTLDYLKEEQETILNEEDLIENSRHVKRKTLKRN